MTRSIKHSHPASTQPPHLHSATSRQHTAPGRRCGRCRPGAAAKPRARIAQRLEPVGLQSGVFQLFGFGNPHAFSQEGRAAGTVRERLGAAPARPAVRGHTARCTLQPPPARSAYLAAAVAQPSSCGAAPHSAALWGEAPGLGKHLGVPSIPLIYGQSRVSNPVKPVEHIGASRQPRGVSGPARHRRRLALPSRGRGAAPEGGHVARAKLRGGKRNGGKRSGGHALPEPCTRCTCQPQGGRLLSTRGAAARCLSGRGGPSAARCVALSSRAGRGALGAPPRPEHRSAIFALLLPVGAKHRACSVCQADAGAVRSGWDQTRTGALVARFQANKMTRHS